MASFHLNLYEIWDTMKLKLSEYILTSKILLPTVLNTSALTIQHSSPLLPFPQN